MPEADTQRTGAPTMQARYGNINDASCSKNYASPDSSPIYRGRCSEWEGGQLAQMQPRRQVPKERSRQRSWSQRLWGLCQEPGLREGMLKVQKVTHTVQLAIYL